MAGAQVTPAAGYTPPDDTPVDQDRRASSSPTTPTSRSRRRPTRPATTINPSSFNVTRAYINVTGNISHIVAFRMTPDVTRVSQPGNSLDGSLTYRLKYAYAQFNLDDWLPKGSWVRLGMQQTPFIDSIEGDLPLPVPGHDLHRARRLHVVVRPRRDLPNDVSQQLRRRPRRRSTTARGTRSPR